MVNRVRSLLAMTVLLVGLAMVSAGCGADGPQQQPALDGTSWTLTGWAEPKPIPASATITAEFAEGRVAGTAGVNRYNAAVASGADGSLAVDQAVTTRMAGPKDAMAAETAYLTRLEQATSYAIDGDTLTIADADGQPSLTFSRA